MTSAYAYGQLANTPGVTSSFKFRPADLSPRLRASAKKMVRERLLRGGWQSKARKIAKLVMAHMEVPHCSLGWKDLNVYESDERLRQQIKELVLADHAAYLLGGVDSSYREDWANKALRENLSRLRTTDFYVDFHDDNFRRRAADAVAEFNMSSKTLANERARRACALLDDPTARIEVTPNLID